MKPIVIRNQVKLSLGRCMQLCLAGMSYRLFRSLVTIAILALAVTFLSHVWAHSVVVQSTQRLAWDQLRTTRLFGEWVARLTDADTPTVISRALVAGDADRLAEYKAWSGSDEAAMQRWVEAARARAQLLRYFDSLPPAARAVVTAGRSAEETIERMAEPARFDEFARHLDDLRLAPPLGDIDLARSLTHELLPGYRDWLAQVRDGHAQAIADVRSHLTQDNIRDALAEPPADLATVLRDAGFRLSDADLELVLTSADEDRMLREFVVALEDESLKQDLQRRMDVARRELTIDRVLSWAGSGANARWLAERVTLDAGQISQLAAEHRRISRLENAAGTTEPQGGTGLLDMPRATRWLVLLSFGVCAIGVTNAMFMSVTERFTEIATMKCLGALDSFLMLLFLIESAIQGMAGAIIGIVLGILLAVLRGMGGYGMLVFDGLPLAALAMIGIGSILAGVMLAVFAAVGPAWMAARLAPMEAMRIE